jgi:hypothetical protein
LYAHWAASTNVWGASNIYFRPDIANGVVGSLTFAKSDQTKSGYQGLYFKWGSLIGVSPIGTFDANTCFYIPDRETGKYYKVMRSEITATYDDGVSAISRAVRDYVSIYSPITSWNDIPYVKGDRADDPEQIAPLSGTEADKRADRRLTDKSADLYAFYKGDICKFLSDTKVRNGSGLTKKWVMPTSDKWKAGSMGAYGSEAMYKKTKSNWSSTAEPFEPLNAVDGTGKNPTALMTYTLDTDEEVIFPAAGDRNGGTLGDVGIFGYYWSSSVGTAANAYYLSFNYGNVLPGSSDSRAAGFPVRCVQEF